jgi:hypothetical protein
MTEILTNILIDNAVIIVLADLFFLFVVDWFAPDKSLKTFAMAPQALSTASATTALRILATYLLTVVLWVLLPEVDAKHTTDKITKVLDVFYDGSGAIALYFFIINILRWRRYRDTDRKGTGDS